MKNKILKLIEFLKDNGYSRNIHVGNTFDWNYYYQIKGFIDGKYFSVSMFDIKSENLHRTKIADNVTECKELLEWLLKEFEIM